MASQTFVYRNLFFVLLVFLQVVGNNISAQEKMVASDSLNIPKAELHRHRPSLSQQPDSLTADSLARINIMHLNGLEAHVDTATLSSQTDSVTRQNIQKVWLPNSSRATWLAAIIPGAGQIYNRKYWKLPIIYGGFVACAYALTWNNMMYADYSQAYLDIMDNDPNTNSYLDFFVGGKPTLSDEQLQAQLKRKKDFYRRNRDLSIFIFIGVYIISIIDAYVDAELSNFDISKDLSLKIEPAVINDSRSHSSSIGLQCSITF